MKFLATKEVSFGSTPSAIKRRMPKFSPGTSFSKAPSSKTWSPVCTLNGKVLSSFFTTVTAAAAILRSKSRLRVDPTASSAFSAVRALGSKFRTPRFSLRVRIRRTESFKRSSEMSPVWTASTTALTMVSILVKSALLRRVVGIKTRSTPALIAIFTASTSPKFLAIASIPMASETITPL